MMWGAGQWLAHTNRPLPSFTGTCGGNASRMSPRQAKVPTVISLAPRYEDSMPPYARSTMPPEHYAPGTLCPLNLLPPEHSAPRGEGGGGQACIGRGGGTPLLQGQPIPSHCLPNRRCQLQWHL